MAAKKKSKKPASRKTRAPAKAAKRAAKPANAASGADESSAVLRASAKSFAARLLR